MFIVSETYEKAALINSQIQQARYRKTKLVAFTSHAPRPVRGYISFCIDGQRL